MPFDYSTIEYEISEKYMTECMQLKTTKINNRRYLGNKYKLLPFIKEIIDKECPDTNSLIDIFSGTGAVSSAFNDKVIYTNDLLYSNYISNVAWFSPEKYDPDTIKKLITKYNSISSSGENYMTENFSDTFFCKDDCYKIGYIREDIEKEFANGYINVRERALLITSLLYAMDKIARTCGHYEAYRKGAKFDHHLELSLPLASNDNNPLNKCFNTDANKLAREISADICFIDPPYNSRDYVSSYHLLENVAVWDKPEVFGVARKMDRTAKKSKYCSKEATNAFEDLINNLDTKYIVLTYNNMAQKGNDRSNAKISDEDILRILKNKGDVKVYSQEYKAFSAGKTNIKDNEERVFVCKCYEKE